MMMMVMMMMMIMMTMMMMMLMLMLMLMMLMMMMMIMMMMMMTLMKLTNSATKFRHGMDKFYQPNSGLRSSRSLDEAIYTYSYFHICIYYYIIPSSNIKQSP